jgi:SAM-dependent methyltransferase
MRDRPDARPRAGPPEVARVVEEVSFLKGSLLDEQALRPPGSPPISGTPREEAAHGERRKRRLVELLRENVDAGILDVSSTVLVVGASLADLQALRAAGFRKILLSNIRTDDEREPGCPLVVTDAQDLAVSSESCDIVAAFEMLHHCRSPHRVLCEMLRAARHHVLILEPNESSLMRGLVHLKLSHPYELLSVARNQPDRGGLCNTGIPNFVYRWNRNEIRKTTSSYLPEFRFEFRTRAYWDFPAGPRNLENRPGTIIPTLVHRVGGRTLVVVLDRAARIMNRLPGITRQGNKWFCIVTKTGRLQPWLKREGGRIVVDRSALRSSKG